MILYSRMISMTQQKTLSAAKLLANRSFHVSPSGFASQATTSSESYFLIKL